MPEDRAVNFSDYIGSVVNRSIVDQAITVHPPTATAAATAQGVLVIRGSAAGVATDHATGRPTLEIDAQRVAWVGLGGLLGGIFEAMVAAGIPHITAALFVCALLTYCCRVRRG